MSNAMASAIFRAAANPSHGNTNPTENATWIARSIRRSAGATEVSSSQRYFRQDGSPRQSSRLVAGDPHPYDLSLAAVGARYAKPFRDRRDRRRPRRSQG